jgi:hypothetical protein
VTAPAFCAHGRLGNHCENCAMVAALERGHTLPTPVPSGPVPDPELAAHDLDVELGDGRSVFVAAGDPIPPEHAARPRRRRSDGKLDKTGRHRGT